MRIPGAVLFCFCSRECASSGDRWRTEAFARETKQSCGLAPGGSGKNCLLHRDHLRADRRFLKHIVQPHGKSKSICGTGALQLGREMVLPQSGGFTSTSLAVTPCGANCHTMLAWWFSGGCRPWVMVFMPSAARHAQGLDARHNPRAFDSSLTGSQHLGNILVTVLHRPSDRFGAVPGPAPLNTQTNDLAMVWVVLLVAAHPVAVANQVIGKSSNRTNLPNNG